MDIFERILTLEDQVKKLEEKIELLELKLKSTNETANVRMPRMPKKTEFFPKVTEELANISKTDTRSEDTVVSGPPKRSSMTTDPRLRAAVDAVTRAAELSKEANLLLEDINHLAKQMMEEHHIQPKGTFKE